MYLGAKKNSAEQLIREGSGKVEQSPGRNEKT
jgi:hypothetical protein